MKKKYIIIGFVTVGIVVVAVSILLNIGINKNNLKTATGTNATTGTSGNNATTFPSNSVEVTNAASKVVATIKNTVEASSKTQSSNLVDTDGDGLPDVAEKTLGTNPFNKDTDGDGVDDLNDNESVFAENPIMNHSTQEGFQIRSILVENNYDPIAKKDVDDHLEITLKNIAGKDLAGFLVYYTITDITANKKEGYIVKLTNFILKNGETNTVHFDNNNSPYNLLADHFGENPNSIYRTNIDAKVFEIMISTLGYKVVSEKVDKDPGGSEKAD